MKRYPTSSLYTIQTTPGIFWQDGQRLTCFINRLEAEVQALALNKQDSLNSKSPKYEVCELPVLSFLRQTFQYPALQLYIACGYRIPNQSFSNPDLQQIPQQIKPITPTQPQPFIVPFQLLKTDSPNQLDASYYLSWWHDTQEPYDCIYQKLLAINKLKQKELEKLTNQFFAQINSAHGLIDTMNYFPYLLLIPKRTPYQPHGCWLDCSHDW